MKKALILAAVLFLSACSGTSVTPDSVAALIADKCGLVVTVADIAALITKNSAVSDVAGYAKMVCDAFHATPPTASTKAPGVGGVVVVDGVPIHYTVK